MTTIDLTEALACVTVTFHPDLGVLKSQLTALPRNSHKIVVDNGSSDAIWAQILLLLATIENAQGVRLEANLGLAAASNVGASSAQTIPGVRWILLLDQDSEPALGAVNLLLSAFVCLTSAGQPVGAVGPALYDPRTDAQHGFHVIKHWIWGRVASRSGAPVYCNSLNGSGSLIDITLYLSLGGLDEGLFIDHVDSEWSFRMAAVGRKSFGVPQAVFRHRMGDHSVRVWLGGWRVWPVRSPLRHRYLFRNAVLLSKRNYVPVIWKIWMVPKLTLTAIAFAAAGPQRFAQIKAMSLGIIDGLRGRTGVL